ncbi:hypothetical protein Tco_1422629 [Tanacetum coccineum]
MTFDNKSSDFDVHPCDRKSGSWVEKLFAYVFNLSKVETFSWANLQISVNDLGQVIESGLSLNGNKVLLCKVKERSQIHTIVRILWVILYVSLSAACKDLMTSKALSVSLFAARSPSIK